MEVAFKLTVEDFITTMIANLRAEPDYRRALLLRRILFSVGGIAVSLLGIRYGIDTYPGLHLLLTGIVIVILGWGLDRFFLSRYTARMRKEYEDQGGEEYSSVTVKLTPERLEYRTIRAESSLDWSRIERVERLATHILLFPNQKRYLIIPLRAFNDPKEADRFVQLIEEYRKVPAPSGGQGA